MTQSQYSIEVEIINHDPAWQQIETVRSFEDLAREAVDIAFGLSGAKLSGPAELALVLNGDADQRLLNNKWRGKDRPTNVLTFPQLEPFFPLVGILGDVILARETIVREAREQHKSLEQHFVHLVVHGFLHILGYDHQTDTEATQMEGLETRILAELGVPDPYKIESDA